ncbi:AAA family ATPase [Persephonella sp.]
MITEIKEIIGFRRFLEIKNLEFGNSKIVIFFGENGSGKTTISRILKLLAKKDKEGLQKLKHDNGRILKMVIKCENEDEVKCIPKNNGENIEIYGDFPFKVEVFNIDFINENIYLGNRVDADIKNNLFKFIFGKHQVDIQKKLDEISNDIKEIDKKIKEKKQEILRLAQIKEREFEDFIKLSTKKSLDTLKSNKVYLEKSLKEQKQKHEIEKLNILSEVNLNSLYSLVKDLKKVCQISLLELESKAKGKLEEHLKIIGKKKKEWLREGLEIRKYIEANICPFCGQEVLDSSLVNEYEVIFNEEYVNLIRKIENLYKDISRFSLSYIVKDISSNDRLIQRWSKYVEDLEIPKINNLENIEKEIKSELEEILEGKKEKIFVVYDKFKNLDKKIEKLDKKIKSYNDEIKKLNQKIEKFKEKLKIGNIDKLNKELELLNRTIKRKELDPLCKEYEKFVEKKKKLEKEKQKLKEDLNKEMNDHLKEYENEINKIFEKFNTDYRIESQKVGTTRKQQTFEYAIKLNFSEESKPNTQLGEILSEGDKTTLAFSVFIAKQKLDTDLDKKIIVIDDPISSLDEYRIFRTSEFIMGITEYSKQIMILTHNLPFLNVFLEKIEKNQYSNIPVFRIEKSKKESSIKKMTLKEARNFIESKLNSYYENLKNIKNLIKEYNDGKSVEEKEIDNAFDDGRIVLEYYLKFKFPEDKFSPIGTIIKNKITNKNPDKGKFLDNLYDVLSKSHHSGYAIMSKDEKISYLKELINFIEEEKIS